LTTDKDGDEDLVLNFLEQYVANKDAKLRELGRYLARGVCQARAAALANDRKAAKSATTLYASDCPAHAPGIDCESCQGCPLMTRARGQACPAP
jgi:hypothetical protein